MPTSDISNVAPIVHEAYRLRPKSILDLGAGAGKYGVLLREYLEVNEGRLQPEQWQLLIRGVEGFGQYVTDLHRFIYNDILEMDFADEANWHKLMGYDLVLMVDSLEHLDRETGMRLLAHLRRWNSNVIVSCPWGASYQEQGAVNGNEFERHRTEWRPTDFGLMGGTQLYVGICAIYRLPGERSPD